MNKNRWKKFEDGDHLTDKEINIMIAESEDAHRYCLLRGFKEAALKITLDLNALQTARFWREHKL